MKRISDKGYIQFGYYCGHTIEEIPDSYLDWILSDFEIDNEEDQELCDVAISEKERRIAARQQDTLATEGVDISAVVVIEGDDEKDNQSDKE